MRKQHHEDLERIKKLVLAGDSKRDIVIEIDKMFYNKDLTVGDKCILTEHNGVHQAGHKFTLHTFDKEKNDATYLDKRDANLHIHNCFQWFRKLDPEELT